MGSSSILDGRTNSWVEGSIPSGDTIDLKKIVSIAQLVEQRALDWSLRGDSSGLLNRWSNIPTWVRVPADPQNKIKNGKY